MCAFYIRDCGRRRARGKWLRPWKRGSWGARKAKGIWRLFLQLESESYSETWRIISDWGGDQDRQMIRDSRGEKGVGTEAEGQTKSAATRLPRVRSLDWAVWVSCCYNSGFPRLPVAPWQRAMTASAGDPKPALPPFTVDLDRAAAPLQAWSTLAISWAFGDIGRVCHSGSRPDAFFSTFSIKPLSHPCTFLPGLQLSASVTSFSKSPFPGQDLKSYKLGG